MFNKVSVQCEIQGQTITLETGYLANRTDGSVYASCGDNRVLATAVSSRRESTLDFFPLTVEYQEKFYSVGRVPGGFLKREGRPSNEAILNARIIDRTIRPCFPEGYKNETQVVATVLSSDGSFPIEVLASIAASTAVHISDIPFNGPVSFLKVALKDGKMVLNPPVEVDEDSTELDMELIVGATANGILMVEGAAQFVSEEQALEALKFAHTSMAPIFKMQDELRKKAGNIAKREVLAPEAASEDLVKQVESFLQKDIEKALQVKNVQERYASLNDIKNKALEEFVKEDSEAGLDKKISTIYEDLKYKIMRQMIIEKSVRIDGRKFEDIRGIHCEIDTLPRAHGSAVFTRGETQVLGTLTLGTGEDEKIIDDLWKSARKKFYLHYNFPPYSVGEVGRFMSQSRREIGHGFLAEKSLKAVVPDHKDFPYTVRLVSEVLSSNGSSSMGTVCSGMMAMLAGGVPVKDTVAGIAMGLVKEGNKIAVLSDILGDEDHLGDMDFKVAGSEKGITALQMDIKTDSIDFATLKQALDQALKGRIHILNEMKKTISNKKDDLSEHAPRIQMMKIKPAKIREVIGSGGKVINGIKDETGANIDINDDGTLFISSPSKEGIEKAISIIEGICAEAEEGKIYEGKVTGIKEFGAFVEILPNTSGLLHISQISKKRIDQVSDVLKEGDTIKVKVLNVESNGRIRLSRKELEDSELTQ